MQAARRGSQDIPEAVRHGTKADANLIILGNHRRHMLPARIRTLPKCQSGTTCISTVTKYPLAVNIALGTLIIAANSIRAMGRSCMPTTLS
ncbi:hypothetical protein OE88DRAFT_997718 [Heliocybe sulcata]|uniref:Uncharacterized protein n=1 Tax=Heliocybe sulcata TaxID=5364 RepID=A0A5C3NGC6_9AGAM|nr:hypothetical protein OE88DRAFT_997718 [Heliocybe sulcata]